MSYKNTSSIFNKFSCDFFKEKKINEAYRKKIYSFKKFSIYTIFMILLLILNFILAENYSKIEFRQLNWKEKILKSSNIYKFKKNQNNNEDLSFYTLVISEIIDKINQMQINFFKKKNNSEELFGYNNYTYSYLENMKKKNLTDSFHMINLNSFIDIVNNKIPIIEKNNLTNLFLNNSPINRIRNININETIEKININVDSKESELKKLININYFILIILCAGFITLILAYLKDFNSKFLNFSISWILSFNNNLQIQIFKSIINFNFSGFIISFGIPYIHCLVLIFYIKFIDSNYLLNLSAFFPSIIISYFISARLSDSSYTFFDFILILIILSSYSYLTYKYHKNKMSEFYNKMNENISYTNNIDLECESTNFNLNDFKNNLQIGCLNISPKENFNIRKNKVLENIINKFYNYSDYKVNQGEIPKNINKYKLLNDFKDNSIKNKNFTSIFKNKNNFFKDYLIILFIVQDITVYNCKLFKNLDIIKDNQDKLDELKNDVLKTLKNKNIDIFESNSGIFNIKKKNLKINQQKNDFNLKLKEEDDKNLLTKINYLKDYFSEILKSLNNLLTRKSNNKNDLNENNTKYVFLWRIKKTISDKKSLKQEIIKENNPYNLQIVENSKKMEIKNFLNTININNNSNNISTYSLNNSSIGLNKNENICEKKKEDKKEDDNIKEFFYFDIYFKYKIESENYEFIIIEVSDNFSNIKKIQKKKKYKNFENFPKIFYNLISHEIINPIINLYQLLEILKTNCKNLITCSNQNNSNNISGTNNLNDTYNNSKINKGNINLLDEILSPKSTKVSNLNKLQGKNLNNQANLNLTNKKLISDIKNILNYIELFTKDLEIISKTDFKELNEFFNIEEEISNNIEISNKINIENKIISKKIINSSLNIKSNLYYLSNNLNNFNDFLKENFNEKEGKNSLSNIIDFKFFLYI